MVNTLTINVVGSSGSCVVNSLRSTMNCYAWCWGSISVSCIGSGSRGHGTTSLGAKGDRMTCSSSDLEARARVNVFSFFFSLPCDTLNIPTTLFSRCWFRRLWCFFLQYSKYYHQIISFCPQSSNSTAVTLYGSQSMCISCH